MTAKILRCNRCGCPSVRWMQTKAGKWYLANRVFESLNPAYTAAVAKVPHKCATHNASHSVAIEDHQAAFYANRG